MELDALADEGIQQISSTLILTCALSREAEQRTRHSSGANDTVGSVG